MVELGPEAEKYHRDAAEIARQQHVSRLFTTGELSRIAAQRFGDGAEHFDSQDALVDALQSELPADATVLVKGSRSMSMERVVSALTGEG